MSHPDFARISDSSFISEFFGIAKTVLTNPAATEQLTMQETLFSRTGKVFVEQMFDTEKQAVTDAFNGHEPSIPLHWITVLEAFGAPRKFTNVTTVSLNGQTAVVRQPALPHFVAKGTPATDPQTCAPAHPNTPPEPTTAHPLPANHHTPTARVRVGESPVRLGAHLEANGRFGEIKLTFFQLYLYADILLDNPQCLQKGGRVKYTSEMAVTSLVLTTSSIKWGHLNYDKMFLNVVAMCLRGIGLLRYRKEGDKEHCWSTNIGNKAGSVRNHSEYYEGKLEVSSADLTPELQKLIDLGCTSFKILESPISIFSAEFKKSQLTKIAQLIADTHPNDRTNSMIINAFNFETKEHPEIAGIILSADELHWGSAGSSGVVKTENQEGMPVVLRYSSIKREAMMETTAGSLAAWINGNQEGKPEDKENEGKRVAVTSPKKPDGKTLNKPKAARMRAAPAEELFAPVKHRNDRDYGDDPRCKVAAMRFDPRTTLNLSSQLLSFSQLTISLSERKSPNPLPCPQPLK